MRGSVALTFCLSALVLVLAGCGAGAGDSSQAGDLTKEAGPQVQGKAGQAKPESQPQIRPKSSAKLKSELKKAAGPPAASFNPKPHHDSGGGSAQFTSPGADNSVEEFGAEANEDEFQAAAAALHDLLDARAQRNWAAACEYLSEGAKRGIAALGAKAPQLKGKGCPTQLGALTAAIATAKLREAAIANVASVRVKGEQAFLIYRGAHGQVEAITLDREGAEWKVASLSAVPLG